VLQRLQRAARALLQQQCVLLQQRGVRASTLTSPILRCSACCSLYVPFWRE